MQKELISYVSKITGKDSVALPTAQAKRLPGKLTSFMQSLAYLKNHPSEILTGTGMGRFSSKLAFRTTGLNIAGGYPARFVYVNEAFRENHLAIFLYYFSKDAQYHSIINTPNSVYNQLATEYGLAGLLLFMIFYVGYFVKHTRQLTFGLPLLLLLLGAFLVDYWFEQLSIVVIFELMMFLNLVENKITGNEQS